MDHITPEATLSSSKAIQMPSSLAEDPETVVFTKDSPGDPLADLSTEVVESVTFTLPAAAAAAGQGAGPVVVLFNGW
jgi:hypothetical protein